MSVDHLNRTYEKVDNLKNNLNEFLIGRLILLNQKMYNVA